MRCNKVVLREHGSVSGRWCTRFWHASFATLSVAACSVYEPSLLVERRARGDQTGGSEGVSAGGASGEGTGDGDPQGGKGSVSAGAAPGNVQGTGGSPSEGGTVDQPPPIDGVTSGGDAGGGGFVTGGVAAGGSVGDSAGASNSAGMGNGGASGGAGTTAGHSNSGGLSSGGTGTTAGRSNSGGNPGGAMTAGGSVGNAAGGAGAGAGAMTTGGSLGGDDCGGCARLTVPLSAEGDFARFTLRLPATVDFTNAAVTMRLARRAGTSGSIVVYVQEGGPKYGLRFGSTVRFESLLPSMQNLVLNLSDTRGTQTDLKAIDRVGIEVNGKGATFPASAIVLDVDTIAVTGTSLTTTTWTFDTAASVYSSATAEGPRNTFWLNGSDSNVKAAAISWQGTLALP